MGEDLADVDLAPIEMYRGDESISVPADIEHNQIPYFVGSWERGMQLIKAAEVRVLHDLEPTGKWGSAAWVPFPKLA